MADVFLSYHGADREAVRTVQRLLHARGLTTFLDRDSLQRGQPWPAALEAGLGTCRGVAVLLGREVGPWQRREMWFALDRQAGMEKQNQSFPVVPVLLPGAEPSSGFLFLNTWVDLRDSLENAEEIAALAGAITSGTPVGPAAPRGDSGVCPYLGLHAFREEDASFFKGREDAIDAVEKKVSSCRLVAVVGTSGSGKSSVVRAGLVPRLRRVRPPKETWDVVAFTPGRDPFHMLARELVAWLEPELTPTALVLRAEELGGRLARGESSLASFVEEGLKACGATRLLLVADQLEELFTETQLVLRKAFAQAVVGLIRVCPVTLVVTLRADFYGLAIDLDRDFSALMEIGLVHLGPMTREQLKQAIEEPAKLAGLTFDPPLLVEKLLDDVGDEPGKLPLLEYALSELWHQRQDNKLREIAYTDFKGVSGAIAARADEEFGKLDDTLKEVTRRVMVRLVRLSSTTVGLERTRCRVALEELGDEARPVVNALSRPGVRLLIAGRDDAGRETVEVAHEALIAAWARLGGWVGRATELTLWRQRLDPSLQWWRRDNANLLRGQPLAEAEKWWQEQAAELSHEERSFIEASVRAREREAEEVAHQHDRELELLRQKADAERAKADAERQKAEAQERARLADLNRLHWTRRFAILASLLLVLSGWAWLSARRESEKARLALADSDFRQAVSLFDADAASALAHLARAIRLVPGLDAPRSLAASVAVSTPIPILRLEHQRPVTDASFSPDGARIVTASDDKTARVWDARTGGLLAKPLEHKGYITALSFNLDGTRIVTGSIDFTARVWDARTGEPVARPLKHQGPVRAASFNRDGTRIVTAAGQKAQVWDARTGEPVAKALQHQGIVYAASFSPDGTRIVTASVRTARVWDARTGEPVAKLLWRQHSTYLASFSPDGANIVAPSDKTAWVWDARTGESVAAPQHQGAVRAASFSPDGTRIVTASDDNTARLWDAQTGEPVTKPLQHQGPVNAASFSPDGTRVITASLDNTARLWDARTGEPVTKPLQHQGPVNAASFSPDGTRIITASLDSTARVWDARTGERVATPLQHAGQVNAASFSPDGTRVLIASVDRTARVWDARTGEPVAKPLQHQDIVTAASFSPDGTRIVTASVDRTAQVWDGRTGEPVAEPLRHQDAVKAASFSPDGTRIVTASVDQTARVWDARTGEPVTKALQHHGPVNAVSFSRDGARIVTVSVSVDNTARVWDARTGEPVAKPLQHQGRVVAASFSPDGNRIVTASVDNTARVWDARTGELVAKPLQHQGWVAAASFSPDGTRIVTASYDKTARVWDAQTAEPVSKALQHQGFVYAASFSPDGTRIVTAADDKTARVWDARTGEPVSSPLQHHGSVYAASFSPDGTRLVTASRDHATRVWDVPSYASEQAAQLADLAEALGGLRLNDLGGVVALMDQSGQLSRLRTAFAKASDNQATVASFGRWLFSDPWTRTISPLSAVTVSQYICDAIRRGAIEEAYRAFPGHPLLRGAPSASALPAECPAGPR